MTALYRISVFCADRVGLISAITSKLFDLGINLGDTTFAVLGSGAKYTSVCEAPEELAIADLKAQLIEIEELKGADIQIKPFELEEAQRPTAKITHRIRVQGGDNPGLVARLSEVFIEFDANIVRLNTIKSTDSSGNQYLIDIAAWIPSKNAAACLATIENTANALQMNCRIQESDT
jgi:glycine cleavage system transcriptional repressor